MDVGGKLRGILEFWWYFVWDWCNYGCKRRFRNGNIYRENFFSIENDDR